MKPETRRIWLSAPHMSGQEIKYIQEAITTNWVSPFGENIEAFEKKLARYLGVPHLLLTNTGTAAIHLALLSCGIGMGDEVIVPTLNFAGCVNPVLYQKAVPIFVDSEPLSWNIDPELTRQTVKERLKAGKPLKAIIAVDLFGIPARADELKAIADEYELYFIQDSADAIGSFYNGSHVGTLGDCGILSFNGNKTITTSAGGAIISHNGRLIEYCRYLSNQARSSSPYYLHEQTGYNYLMSNVLAGIGVAQMQVLPERVQARQNIYAEYKALLEGHPQISFHHDMEGAQSNRWLSTVLIEDAFAGQDARGLVYEKLNETGIESRPVWLPMHLQPAFKDFPIYGGGVAELLFDNGLCLPSSSTLSRDDVNEISNVIQKALT